MTKDMELPSFALAFEGRLLAHRRLLVEFLRRLPEDRFLDLMDWMDERTQFVDGQEDPGAVPSPGIELELSGADEFMMIKRLAEAKR